MSWADDMSKAMDEHPEDFGMVIDDHGNPMTDPQTPATEAGRRLLGHDIRTDSERVADRGRHSAGYEKLRSAILAIEAEARAQVDRHDTVYLHGRADALREAAATADDAYWAGHAKALREAAERVRALSGIPAYDNVPPKLIDRAAVLAILDPEAAP